MDKMAAGMLAGTALTALGVAWVMNDKKMRKQMVKGSKRAVSKAGMHMDNLW